jgi:hypothetical protein
VGGLIGTSNKNGSSLMPKGMYTTYGETILDASTDLNLGEVNGFLFVQQRSATNVFNCYVVTKKEAIALTTEYLSGTLTVTVTNGNLHLKGTGVMALYITYRVLNFV